MEKPTDVLKNVGGRGSGTIADFALDMSGHATLREPRIGTIHSYGLAKHAKKGEDASAAVNRGRAQIYGVFDGHGGGLLALELSELLPRLLAQVSKKEEVVDAYYEADTLLGAKYERQGSTATCAVVEPVDEGQMKVTISWVGDSKLVCLDMVTKSLVLETELHHVTTSSEIDRLEEHWKTRQNSTSSSDEQDIIVRGRQYEKRVETHVKPSVEYVRDQSLVCRRRAPNGAPSGPLVVQAMWKNCNNNEAIRGASTCVTRAVGDWDSSRTLVPHPDVVVHVLRPPVAWRRYLAASDGLWDVISTEKAKKVLSEYLDPQQAADALLRSARRRYAKQNSRTLDPFGDDTTVLVFDVKIGNPAFVKPKKSRSLTSIPGLCQSSDPGAVLQASSSSPAFEFNSNNSHYSTTTAYPQKASRVTFVEEAKC